MCVYIHIYVYIHSRLLICGYHGVHICRPIIIFAAAAAKLLQPCPTLCDPMDCSPPGSSIHGIFQARVLEWGAIAFSSNYIYLL